jgi:lysophospholipase L1-like esterase
VPSTSFSARAPVALAIALLVSLLAAAGATAATKPPRVTPGSTYLALGDSVTFGYQEPEVVPKPDYAKPSSFAGYPEILGRAWHLKVFNGSCPGETSSSFIDTKGPSYFCENGPPPSQTVGYRNAFPLHVKYKGSQLAYAIAFLRKHPKTRLVSLLIGANDGFRCQATTADRCTSAAEQSALIKRIRANVRTIVSGIRRKGHYHGQLVVLSYYAQSYSSPGANAAQQSLSRAVFAAAKPYGAVQADGYGAFRAAVGRSGNDSCQAALLTQLGDSGSCGVHPSYSGEALLALAVQRVVRR